MNEESPETAQVSFSKLAGLLRQRLVVIADREWYARDAAGHLAALQTVSEAIEAAARGLPKPVDAQLAHYLERRSYDKALAFLEEQKPPAK
jgi:hypothetical protein